MHVHGRTYSSLHNYIVQQKMLYTEWIRSVRWRMKNIVTMAVTSRISLQFESVKVLHTESSMFVITWYSSRLSEIHHLSKSLAHLSKTTPVNNVETNSKYTYPKQVTRVLITMAFYFAVTCRIDMESLFWDLFWSSHNKVPRIVVYHPICSSSILIHEIWKYRNVYHRRALYFPFPERHNPSW